MKSLTITLWNIQGIQSSTFGCKTNSVEFQKNISNIDIIILHETWRRSDETTLCPTGYREIAISSRKNKGVTRGRDSGGIIIWHKVEIDKYISLVKKEETHIWFKIKRQLTQTTKDIFVCTVYIPPSESPYYSEEIFDTMQHQINHYQTQGNVLVCGDLNARTGSLPDFTADYGNKHIFGQSFPQNVVNFPRNSSDRQVNKIGKLLIELCQSLGLYLVNGRVRGDSLGRCTYSSPLGCSTVDYMLTDLDLSNFKAFTVKPLTPLSDHCQITAYLNRTEIPNKHEQPSKLYHIRNKYKWTRDSKENYITAFCHPKVSQTIENILLNYYPHNTEGVNLAVEHINHTFDYLAEMSALQTHKKRTNMKKKDEKWFDLDCKIIRKKLRKLSNQKHRQPNSADLHLRYHEELKQYKKTLRKKKEQHIQNQLQTIEESLSTNSFWENWNSLHKKPLLEPAIQDGDTWKEYFENLYTKPDMNHEQNHIFDKLTKMENTFSEYQNQLDYPITEKELSERLQALKPKKASGPDGILNEMLKHSNHKLQLAILKVFNLILSVGYFPNTWNTGLITPIYKSGEKLDPNNYRGICVSSNLGKLFCSILNIRLTDFLIEHSVLNKSQIGFLPNHRTSDHIFTLQTIIDKNINQNKSKLFACFIDFQKAFDSIWHEGLFTKLIESGIGGRTYSIIKTMYLNNKCAIKIGNKQTSHFTQGRGVRQGCPLSPTLFNIYINELANQLEQSKAPGLTLYDSEIKFLLFADDLVLLSPTPEGLQQSLDIVQQFCKTWALTINMKKTKILIFQKRTRRQGNKYNFMLNKTKIEHVTNYTYLGLKFSANGTFNLAMNELKNKARRAFYAIRKSIQIKIPIRTWLRIFQSVIEPIALYGSEVWGHLTNLNFEKWDKNPIETLHAEFCRNILRMQRKIPNTACRAELGQYPLSLKIEKRTIKFWQHLQTSEPTSYHFKALKSQELTIEKRPLIQLVQRLHQDTPHERMNTNQIINTQKERYLTYWKGITQKQSKLQNYLALKRDYKLANYLTTVSDTKLRKLVSRYRLSGHSLAIETGRHRQTWVPQESRLCVHCDLGQVETELHFLTSCPNYNDIRNNFYPKFKAIYPQFSEIEDSEKARYLLGEEEHCALLAAHYIYNCDKKRTDHSVTRL